MTNASNRLLAQLRLRESEGRPVRVGILGTGSYGESLVAQLRHTPGVTPAAVCDLVPSRAVAAYEFAGYAADEVTRARHGVDVDNAVLGDRPVVCTDAQLVVDSPVEVIVDCTGEANFGCELALSSIRAGKHVVMVNVEADMTAGAQLAEAARKAGVVYTLADGDQPSLVVGLVDWAESLGFEIAAAGKWTTLYPKDIADARLSAKTDRRKSDVTYFDGTKSQIEMAAAANAAGLCVDVTEMHRLSVGINDLPGRLCPADCGGVLTRTGVVDVIDCTGLKPGDFHPGGVFVVVTSKADRALRAMAEKGIPVSDDGRFALIYHPYHLVGAETSRSICLAAIEGLPTASPAPTRRVEVVGVTKRALPAGTQLAGMGSEDVRGIAVNAEDAAPFLPLGLTDGATLTRDVAAGTRLHWNDVIAPPGSSAWALRT